MQSKLVIFCLVILCSAAGLPAPCAGEDSPPPLAVNGIEFIRDKSGSEKISILCNHTCAPEWFSLAGENPRVVMDLKGVFQVRPGVRNLKTEGPLVKGVRRYWDKRTRILRVVLDLAPGKHYTVHPLQDPSGKTYTLTIKEDSASPRAREKRITILRPDPDAGKQEGKRHEAVPGSEKRPPAEPAADVPSVERGRAQMNAGAFSAAADTFTRILAADPEDRLSYRLRGNAYDNLGDHQRAVADWTRAARLGDAILQSYLDFLQVRWREEPPPGQD
jgi:hypothetical protein